MTKQYPYGWWECTESKFKDFVVGFLYECKPDEVSTPRVYTHDPKCCWAPYWVEQAGKFCYLKSELDFKYVGPTLLGCPKKDSKLEVSCEYQPDKVIVNGITYITGAK